MLILRSLFVFLFVLLMTAAFTQIPKFNSYSAATATVFLDFDGHVVKGTAWNWDSTIRARPSGLSSSRITEIFNRIAEDFRIFNLNITTDSTVFKKAPIGKRMRVIFTPTSDWYGTAAGVSFINSFTWGDDTPAWVFSGLLEGNPKYIGEAASHEIGHTLGLQHQSVYNKNCSLVNEYAEGKGSGEIGWAPIMGVGYYRNVSVWTVGQSIEGCSVVQNDINTIGNGENHIGFRTDEHGNTRQTATNLILTRNNFQAPGIINNSNDRDFFKITLTQRLRLKARVTPSNVGANNSGANVDLFLSLIKSTGDSIGRYNPKSLLNASLDTILPAGVYYFGVDGTLNQNMNDYGSVGLYSLAGSLESITPSPTVLVRGDIKNNHNILKWNVEGETLPRITYLEYSIDGTNFTSVPVTTSSYVHRSPGKQVTYRVKMILPDETTEYSNVITLTNTSPTTVSLTKTIVTNSAEVRSSGDYSYQLMDAAGRLLSTGKLTPGTNEIPLRTIANGVLIMKIFNRSEQYQLRLIKQ
jgi:hypothetical protein